MIYIIAADSVKNTGKVSFKFMFDSGAPLDDLRAVVDGDILWRHWGFLHSRAYGENEFRPFELGKSLAGEDHGTIFPSGEGEIRYEIFVFRTGDGQVMTAGVDGKENMHRLMEEAPNCVLLTTKTIAEDLTKQLEPDTFKVFECDGELSTSS